LIVYEDLGVPLTHLKVSPGDTITELSSADFADFLSYTERTFAYTSGGTVVVVAGDVLEGQTGGDECTVISRTITSGTDAGGDAAGVMRVKSCYGLFAAGEKYAVAAGTDDGTVTAPPIPATNDYLFKGANPISALVSCYAQTCLVNITGAKPDQSQLNGQPMAAGSSWVLRGYEDIKNLKFVDYTSGSASTLQITFFY
jgi:hypothetical protein